jgi:hypothetical protein
MATSGKKGRYDGTANLIPMNMRGEEEQKALRIKGGKASGEARRKKKMLGELLEIALALPCRDADGDNWNAITVALIQKAAAGDTKAYEIIRDTIGQKPTDKLEAEMKGDIDINVTVGN